MSSIESNTLRDLALFDLDIAKGVARYAANDLAINPARFFKPLHTAGPGIL